MTALGGGHSENGLPHQPGERPFLIGRRSLLAPAYQNPNSNSTFSTNESFIVLGTTGSGQIFSGLFLS